MALETLENVKKIGEFNLIVMDKLRAQYPEKFRPDGSMHYHWLEKEIRLFNFIYLRQDVNSISFTLQNGPIKENGVNGCQVDSLIETAKLIIEGFNDKFPCDENAHAIVKLKESLLWLEKRRKNRTKRGVEGYNKE